MASEHISLAHLAETELEPAPIHPDWIIRGNPEARCRILSASSDGAARTALWDCTAGVFDWYFQGDETVHILDGEVTVTGADGITRRLGPGDVALFRAGTRARWEVSHYVRKLAFCRDPMPAPLNLAMRALNKGRRVMARMQALAGAQPARLAPLLLLVAD